MALLVFAEQHAWTADAKFKAFAAHGFDENTQLKLAAASHFEAILVFCFRDADGHIALGFAHEAVADHAASDFCTFPASHWAVVHRKAHRQCWRIDWLRLKRLSHRRLGDSICDGRGGHTGDRDDVACLGFFNWNALQASEGHDLRCAAGFDDLAVRVQRMNLLVHLDGA